MQGLPHSRVVDTPQERQNLFTKPDGDFRLAPKFEHEANQTFPPCQSVRVGGLQQNCPRPSSLGLFFPADDQIQVVEVQFSSVLLANMV